MQRTSTYQDNRYWAMYKLPMFGCTDSSQVLKEIQAATKSFPNAYIRLVAFNPDRQVQVAGMLVHRPTTVNIHILCIYTNVYIYIRFRFPEAEKKKKTHPSQKPRLSFSRNTTANQQDDICTPEKRSV